MSLEDLDREDGPPREERRRQEALKIVKKAGFGPWRRLVDRADNMLVAGYSEQYCIGHLQRNTPRLPIWRGMHP